MTKRHMKIALGLKIPNITILKLAQNLETEIFHAKPTSYSSRPYNFSMNLIKNLKDR